MLEEFDPEAALALIEKEKATAIGVVPTLGVTFTCQYEPVKAVAGARHGRLVQQLHHVAEQAREVSECLQFEGARPVRWLLENLPVDASWCLVHATHMNNEERADAPRRRRLIT